MKIEDVMTLVRPCIAQMEPYSTARDEYKGSLGILMDANENPFPHEGMNRYPSTAQRQQLLRAIAKLKGVGEEQVFLGNGSDEAIDLCFRVFCVPGKDNVVSIAPTYGMYSVCAAMNDVEYRPVQLNADYTLPVDLLLAAADDNTKLLFVCSPNNPTSNAFPRQDIAGLAERFRGIVVVDEAYIDFADTPSMKTEIERLPNVVVLQTLSKAYGMAGLRVGIAIAAKPIVDIYNKVRYPYNIGTDTLALALKMLSETKEPEQKGMILAERRRLGEALKSIPEVEKVYPSDANFLLVKVRHAQELYDYLIGRGVIVRNRNNVQGCEGCLRITIGMPVENFHVLEEIKKFSAGE